jgi:serine O-acetyltransferase
MYGTIYRTNLQTNVPPMPNLKELLSSDLQRQWELERGVASQNEARENLAGQNATGRHIGDDGLDKKPSIHRPGFGQLLCRLLHPRFLPIALCRASRAALLAGIPALPQLLGYLNLVLFGLEVAPRCEIGPGIFFPHPSGTVIGSWHIGSNVTIFQGVTLGSQKLDMGFDSSLRPEIGDDVVIGAGAKILGGIRIGNHVTVGANAVVVDSIENGCTVVGIPGRPLRSHVPAWERRHHHRSVATSGRGQHGRNP